MNSLLEPRCTPQLPDLMLMDEMEVVGDDDWLTGLACLAPCYASVAAPPAAASAPMPIGRRQPAASTLVDSLESTQTLLGSSLQEISSAQQQAAQQQQQYGMRFVPVPLAQAPQPQYQPQYQQHLQAYSLPAAEPVFGSYDKLLAQHLQQLEQPQQQPCGLYQQQPQQLHPHSWHPPSGLQSYQPPQPQQHRQQYQGQQQEELPAFQLQLASDAAPQYHHVTGSGAITSVDAFSSSAWDLPTPTLPVPMPVHAAHRQQGGGGGIHSHDLQSGYSMQFGQQLPVPIPIPQAQGPGSRMRRAASEATLPSGFLSYEASGTLAPVAELESSEGSDEDTDTLNHHIQRHHHRYHRQQEYQLQQQQEGYPQERLHLPLSRSAPAASLMMLERSNSSRRGTHPAGASRLASTASPKTISLKIKAPSRPRSTAAAAAASRGVAAAPSALPLGEVSPRPSRLSARRSIALSAAAVADEEEDFASDSDGEPVGSMEGSEERGSAAGAGTSLHGHGSASGKKKHNPWSLTETEVLVEGVRLLGPSKWAEIKKMAVGGIGEVLTTRSAVDLKDKWRNLTRVAKLPKSVLKARAHKSTSEIPLDLLLTVKDLMEMGRE